MRVPAALSLILLTACGNGLGDGLQIRGKLGAEFGGTPAARSADSGTVDTLVAVPHTGGVPFWDAVATAEADADARFEITIEQYYDHVLMFVDSTTDPDPTVLGFLAMPAGSDSVVNLTTSDATSDVNAGDVTADEGEALGSEDVSTELGLTAEQFAQLARGDDAFKNISNGWLNRDGDTYTSAGVSYWFEGSFESADTPGAAAFRPPGIGFGTNDPALVASLPQICSGERSIELVPPGPVTFGGATYGPDTPLTNANLDQYCQGALGFGEYPGELWMSIPGELQSELPSGWWLWNVDGEEIGFYKLDYTLPVDADNHPTVPIPTLDITETGGAVEARITWWVHDGSNYVEFTDLALLERLFASVGIHVSTDGSKGQWEQGWDANLPLDQATFEGWTLDGTGQTEGQVVGEISLAYVLAGTQYMFSWRGNPVCGNNWAEGDEECDGSDVGVTCEDLGLIHGGYVSCSECAYDTSTCAEGLLGTRVSSDQLAFSLSGGSIDANTIAWEVAADAFTYEGTDLWATLSQDSTLTGLLPLASGEDGVRHIGRGMQSGDAVLVAFQVASPGVTTGAERLQIWDGPPDALNPPTLLWEGPNETWTVRTAQSSVNNTITTIDTPDDGAPLGALQRVIVSGTADGLGGTGRIDLHAATDLDWRSDYIELESVAIEAWQAGTSTAARLCADEACTSEANPLQDALIAYVPDDAAVDWQATFTFRMAATLPTPVTNAALVHDSATGLQGPAGVPGVGLFPAANALTLTLDDTFIPPSVADPTSWLLMEVHNPTDHDIMADGVGFDLPDHVTVIDLVGWHDQGGLGWDVPPNLLATPDGTRMLVYDRLVIPANSSADFQARLQFDGTLGVYPIDPFVVIGDTEITADAPLVFPFDGSASSCAAGAYYDTSQSGCAACPTGTTSVAGSGSVDDCFPCPADTYLQFGGCVPCPQGMVSPEGSVNPGDCEAAPTAPVITTVDFSPRYDAGIDAIVGETVQLFVEAASAIDHPVTEVAFEITGPNSFRETVQGAPGQVSWTVDSTDPVGAYVITAVAFNDIGGSAPFTLDEPIDVGVATERAWGQLRADPPTLETGVARGEVATAQLTLTNVGLASLANLEIAVVDETGAAAPSWSNVVTGSSIASLAVGASASATIAIAPDPQVATTEQDPYRFYVETRVGGAVHHLVPLLVWVDTPGVGAYLFKVEDVLTGTYDDQGLLIEGVAGARITLDRREGSPHNATLLADSAGEALFEDVPSGNYRFRVSHPGHQAAEGFGTVVSGSTSSDYVWLDMNDGPQDLQVGEQTLSGSESGRIEASIALDTPSGGTTPATVAFPFTADLTRQLFAIDLAVANLDAALPMEQVRVDALITDFAGYARRVTSDPDAAPGTADFFLREDTHTALAAVDGTASIAADTTATAHFTLVPAPGTAGTSIEGTRYFVGFTVSWSQDGQSFEEEVPADVIYVRPLQDVWLDATTHATWLGDNAHTGTTEPSEAAALGLRVSNRAGNPAPMTVSLGTPVITDPGGHGFSATVTAGELDGTALSDPTFADLGAIERQSAAMVTWEVEASHLAGVTDLTLELTPDPDLGGALTSLVRAGDAVCSRGAVRSDLPNRDAVADILSLGDCAGATGLTLYESELIDLPVVDRTAGQTLTEQSAGVYTLTVPNVAGWVHARVELPAAMSDWTLTSCQRSDGKTLDPANCFGDSSYTTGTACGALPACATSWVELFDRADPAAATYTLTFTP
ncbi:MAG: hypothetical protein EP330_15860 [Deltaproteobacteria bacterium]|nr:MAG: hypothetical protein EP330_15860 [Deltaproteobacteria bacterium]